MTSNNKQKALEIPKSSPQAKTLPTTTTTAQTMGWFEILKTTVKEWIDDKVPQLGASLAFYSVLSLAPLVLISIAIAGTVFGAEAAQGEVLAQLRGLLGVEGARAIEDMIANAREPSSGAVAGALGLITLLFGASGVFGQLQDALNTIWGVEPKPGRGVWGIVRDRFLSFGMVLTIGFLLLVSLILGAAVSGVGSYAQGLLPAIEPIVQLLNFALSLALTTLLFGLIYKILPDVKIVWRDIWVGALLTAVFFTIGKLLIGLYLGKAAIGSTYGAAGSLVVLLIWIYYSAQVVFFGAEFTQVYAKRSGSPIEPAKGAQPIENEVQKPVVSPA